MPSLDLTYARIRFASVLATACAGALLAVASFTFAPHTVRWVGFGSGCGVLVVTAVGFAATRRGAVQRVLDLPLALIAAWEIVCSRAIEQSGAGASPAAVKWFNLAAGAAICALGTLGLLLHERGLEHDLEGLDARARTAGR